MKRRILSILLVMCLIMSVLPLRVHADTITGSCGENVTWSLDKSSWVLTISGSGPMRDYYYLSGFDWDMHPWQLYDDDIKRVVIEDGVTRIGDYSFPHFKVMTRVDIADSVEEIGQGAFYDCEKLSTISLPDNLKEMEQSSFKECSSISSITIPAGVTAIPGSCFKFCVGLNRVYLKDNLQIIDDDAFYGCEKLWTIDIPDTVTTIGSNAFDGCISLQTITIPDSVTEMGYRAFSNCTSLRTATISYRVSRLDNDLFAWCEDLHTVTLRGDAPDISDSAFSNVEATVYYSSHNESWTEDVMQDYGGTLTWKSKSFHGYRVVDEPATCTEDGYSALVCDCGLVEDEVVTPAIGHDYQDNKCKNCYQRDPDYRFSIGYANMTLGNSLAMNFAFPYDALDYWGEAYVQIDKTYADGRDTKTVTIPNSQWGMTSINGELHYLVTFNGIAAKEMADMVYVTVYDAEGKALSHVWEDSVRSYAMRTLDNPNTAPESLTMIVDLLNYGAAAQLSFGYDVGNLANNKLTAQQAALATPSAWAEDSRVAGENYLGSQLRLESQIMLRMAFSNVTADMTAQVSFTDHYDRPQSYTIPGSSFEISGNTAVVTIDKIVVADARKDVTVQIIDGDGNVVASATDSVAGYIARMRQEEEDPLYEAILKFADSAYLYFHPGAQLPSAPEPAHSQYYIEGLSQDRLVEYFNEVCFCAAYGTNTPYIHKWSKPIEFLVVGDTHEASMEAMADFLDALNEIEGFPGIVRCYEPNAADWAFFFCREDEMGSIVEGLPEGGGFGSATNIVYNNAGQITTMITAVRKDLDQQTSTSAVLEEIYNGLGPLLDTVEREDSIIYQHSSSVTELSDIDWLILKLLYNEAVLSGMDKTECEAVLRSLYW